MKVAIADSNKDYAKRLTEVLQEYNGLTVSMYTSAEKLEKAMLEEGFDIVIFDPDLSDEVIIFPSTVALCVYLYCSGETRNAVLYKDMMAVKKYQKINKIYKEILHKYSDIKGFTVDFSNDQLTKLIGVYSPIGGSGKTVVSMAIASQLRQTGEKVLFISGEQLDSSAFVNPHSPEEDGINLLIASMKNENSTFRLKLEAVTKTGYNGFDYIEGFDRIVDYQSATESEIRDVLTEIKEVSTYRYVVIDMGSVLDNVNTAILKAVDQVILVEKPGEIPEKKLEMFEDQPAFKDNVKKFVKLMNFADSRTREKYFTEIPTVGLIQFYGNLAVKDIIRNIGINQEIYMDTIVV